MKGPIENLPRQIEEDPSFVDAQKTPIHTLYFPQASNEEKVNIPTPTSESALAANRQPIHELSLALETTPTITLSPVESPSPEATPGAEVVVNALNVRSGPGTAYPAIDGLFRGASVAVVGRAENGWLKVHWQEGDQEKEGWVSGKSSYVATNEKVEEAPLLTLTAEAISPSPTATPRPTPTAEPTSAAIIQEKSAEKEVEVCRAVFWGDRNQPEVALTFDDGFSAQAIQTTLEVLRANNIQGTFFVIGSQLKAYPDLWRQAAADGHQICNHTYTHTYLSSLSGEEIKEELARWEAAAGEVLGEEYVRQMKQEFPYVRFPGGAGHNSEGVLEAVAEAGYRPIAWSAETYAAVLKNHDLKNEAVAPIADEVRQHTVNAAQNGAIILLHFNSWDTLYLEQTVRGLIDKGLTPASVSKVLD